MTLQEIDNEVYFICFDESCMVDVQSRHNTAFVFICYECRHKDHSQFPANYGKDSKLENIDITGIFEDD